MSKNFSYLRLYMAASCLAINCQFLPLASSLVLSKQSCPKDLDKLTELLLQDLPDYTNRVIQRSRTHENSFGDSIYVIVAGRPEFEPLNLNVAENIAPYEKPIQIFFTTLERRYLTNRVIEAENYHWLFITQTPSGWRMVTLFTRFGNSATEQPPSPPRESSNGTIGQAINLWLRDCRASQN